MVDCVANSVLYNENISAMLLGNLMKQPSLLSVPQYPLVNSDFAPNDMHKIIFRAITVLYNQGVGEITPVELDNVIKNPTAREVLEDNDWMGFVETTKELSSQQNYDYCYNVVRKLSLLRELKSDGIDISQWFDELEDSTKQFAKLEKITIQDILNTLETTSLKLRGKYDVKYVREEMVAGTDVEDLLAEFETHPSFGAFLTSNYLTQIINGINRGDLFMRSAGSGVGKSRIAVADMCGLCVDKYYDYTAEQFVDNPNYQGPGFMIHTELRTREQIQPMYLACISGVPYGTITRGEYTQEEKARVLEAGEILKKNDFYLAAMPDFTTQSIERKIRECVEQRGAVFCSFDYMMLNSALTVEYKAKTATNIREDMVLRALATDLKEMAEDFNVGILTASQLNGAEKTMEFPDESCLSGSKAMKNKLDHGVIMLAAKDRAKELKAVEKFGMAIGHKGFGKPLVPNRITYVYKARFGEYADQKIKIFHHFDGGTMRNTDLFCCDENNYPVDIKNIMPGG